jgi:leucyl aminopeptidase
MGTYRFNTYKTTSKDCNILKLQIGLGSGKFDSADRKALGASAERGTIIGDGVCTARDLVNEPPSELYPESFADRAKAMSEAHGLKIKVIGPAQLKKMGANLILAVGQGSVEKPRLVHMTYTPDKAADRKKKPIVFVGKGITFDSGGLCLKPAGGMLDMKMDMGGAAAVTGAMHAIARLKPNVPVHGILSCAENMPAGNAYRLGDVVTGMSGVTVEINNTDAEGRLVLADALHYATGLDPECIVDLATLTGAIVVALGGSVGLFSNSDELAGDLLMHSDNAGEHFWRMPLTEKLKDMLNSDIADTKNTGERAGGSITAALFLQKFVGENKWAHLDIAGAAYGSSTAGASAKGGSGAAVATLVGLATADS